MKSALLQLLRVVVIAGAAAAAIYSLILARAAYLFQQDTPVSVAAAVRLQPRNAAYLDRLASWQPDDRRTLLRRSVAEDPFNFNAWIRLGLLAEMQAGDNSAAEQYYLKAAAVNHMFLPRWTLANFYFRQQKPGEFFHWTRQTLEITPYASDPVFAQMWQATQNQDLLNAAIPDRPRVLLQYAWFLSTNKHFASIPYTVERLVQAVGKDDPGKWGRDDLLAAAEDHMLAAGEGQPAINVWSTMKQAGWLEQSVPNDQRPLTNGDFRLRFYRHAFDWVTNESPGTRVEQYVESNDVRINLHGDEPEKCTLLQEYVAAAPSARYNVTWRAQADDLSAPSGLAWHLHAIGGGTVPEVVSPDLLSPHPAWEFTTPAGAKTFLLSLEYARPMGVTRAHGAIVLKAVTMERK
jgi:tetratricopeptide (TPR) repeat protein